MLYLGIMQNLDIKTVGASIGAKTLIKNANDKQKAIDAITEALKENTFFLPNINSKNGAYTQAISPEMQSKINDARSTILDLQTQFGSVKFGRSLRKGEQDFMNLEMYKACKAHATEAQMEQVNLYYACVPLVEATAIDIKVLALAIYNEK